MPVEPSSRLAAQGRKELLQRFLSNEGIGSIPEEEPCFPLPYRGHPAGRGVDHIRGSRCFIDANLHGAAAAPHREGAAAKKSASSSSSSSSAAASSAVSPPMAENKPSTSLLSGWLARLRLLSH
ncbi:Connector enhancer of kinase suppressor of ras 3 [Liparis tanakae]|uniref:Connector enhancer of kinase suppressor of ras 3 n=1 Tax=Liparis tanakae TaxID=230148 RepID=A0A4Z2E0T7_9TELE|nr:Connector enhancer of kinase suppressor of ras 3 [Liparis tanakae]